MGHQYAWLVIRMAFRHSVDITQYILFVMFLLGGLVALAAPPALRPMIPDVTGWHIAVSVLGAILAVRMLLAPYWLWEEQRKKAEFAQAELAKLGESLHRNIHYLPAGVGLRDDAISGVSLSFRNTGPSMLRVSLIRAVATVHGTIIGRVETPTSQIVSGGEVGVFSIPLLVADGAGNGVIEAEFQYDDIPPKGVRRSLLTYIFPADAGGYCGHIVHHDEV